MTTVLVKKTQESESFHKTDDGETPRCVVNDAHKPYLWKPWAQDDAEIWKEPCQNPQCYGEGYETHETANTSAWPG